MIADEAHDMSHNDITCYCHRVAKHHFELVVIIFSANLGISVRIRRNCDVAKGYQC